MMKNAQWIINSETNERCGGHITVSCKDPRFSSSSDLYDRIKIPMAILYSLYRYRLRNEYCNSNKILNKDNDIENSRITSPLNRKTGCIEIRLPNRVRNIEQLQRRYELMYEIMQGALIENQNFGQIVDRCYPIIVQMYDGSKSKADRIVELAFMFRNFLATGEIHSEISEFI